jgi:hypothetical protein
MTKYILTLIFWVGAISCVAMVAVFAKLIYLPFILHYTFYFSQIPENLIKIISLMFFWMTFWAIFYLIFKKIPIANKLLNWFVAMNKKTFWKNRS